MVSERPLQAEAGKVCQAEGIVCAPAEQPQGGGSLGNPARNREPGTCIPWDVGQRMFVE